jgi:hypothetical protein
MGVDGVETMLLSMSAIPPETRRRDKVMDGIVLSGELDSPVAMLHPRETDTSAATSYHVKLPLRLHTPDNLDQKTTCCTRCSSVGINSILV